MPYRSNSDLPESVRKVLPSAAQSIFRGAYNGFYSSDPDASEESAFKIAWVAVKRKYRKEGEEWVAKDHLQLDASIDFTFVGDDGTFEGYAAFFNLKDGQNEIILPGAFKQTLEEQGIDDIRMLYQHDNEQPIGVWEEIREDDIGLFVRGRLILEVERAREVLALMKAGALRGMSIGFDDPISEREGYLSGLKLIEISIVTFPAQTGVELVELEDEGVMAKHWGSRRTSDQQHVSMCDTILFDASDIRLTGDGFLVATPRVARTGVQLYKGHECGRMDMDEVRVYRPEGEVFNRDTLHSYAHRPLTNDHPSEPVTADNWKKYAVGQTGDEVARDGEFVRVPLVIMDGAAIKAYKDGKRELSLGYTCDLKWGPGKTSKGEMYDAIQSNIRANHLAIVAAARGGKELRLGDNGRRQPSIVDLFSDEQIRELADLVKNHESEDTMSNEPLKQVMVDGLPVMVSDMAANVVQRAIGNFEKSIDGLKAKLKEELEEKEKEKKAKDAAITDAKAKDAEIVTLKQQLKDAEVTPAKLDTLVKDRAAVIGKAKSIMGDKLVVDGKSIAEIRKQVVEAKLGDGAKGWNDEQVAASFGTLTAGIKDNGGRDQLADALSNSTHHNQDAVEKAYADRDKDLTNAWRSPKPAAAATQ